jgi:hypothetical protein
MLVIHRGSPFTFCLVVFDRLWGVAIYDQFISGTNGCCLAKTIPLDEGR